MLKILFHLINSIFLILYLYPGSIIGYLVYNDLSKQPELTSVLFSFSTNHFFSFFILTFIGILSFKNVKIILIYLILISIILEISHFLIPNRSFQFSDLFGNVFGVLFSLLLIKMFDFWRN